MRSKVSIQGHPIHPMLVPLPIGLLVGCLASDIAFTVHHDPFWGQASVYLALGGFITGALAAVVGLIDFLGIAEVRRHRIAWVHFLGNAVALVLALSRVLYSWSEPASTVLPTGITLSVLFTLILLVTGWLGGELAYRYRIGVIDDKR
jgi:uncharacterized membrane protein